MTDKAKEGPEVTVDSTDVDPLEVAQLLEAEGFNLEGGPAETAPASEEERTTIPADTTYSPEAPVVDHVMDWVLASGGLEKATPTAVEKAEFLRAALNNESLELDITVMGGTKVRVRTLTDHETDVLFLALRQGGDMSEVEYYTEMQRYGLAMQVVSVGGKTANCHKPGPEDDAPAQLIARAAADAITTNAARTAMARAALRVFSAKMKHCTENLLNMDFWNPVDAG